MDSMMVGCSYLEHHLAHQTAESSSLEQVRVTLMELMKVSPKD